jgi:hypothetical protein
MVKSNYLATACAGFLLLSVSAHGEESFMKQLTQKPASVEANNLQQADWQSAPQISICDVSEARSAISLQPVTSHRAKPSRVASVASLVGSWVHSYEGQLSYYPNSGCAVAISQVANTDSVLITNFFGSGVAIKAKVDVASSTISIPPQKLFDHATYGEVDIAPIASDATAEWTTDLVGTISDNEIYFSHDWGVFIAGTNANYKRGTIAGIYGNTIFKRANGTMSSVGKSSSGDVNFNFAIYAEQTSENILTIKNFQNYGQTVEITLNLNRSATIPYQEARYNTSGTWYTVGNLTFSDSGNLSSYTYDITTDVATDNRSIKWSNWSMIVPNTYYLGQLTDTSIDLNFDLSYPTLSVSSFQGEGTLDSPYLIKTRDDMVLLAKLTNENSEYIWQAKSTESKYARAFVGQYFRLENDIDFKNYRTDPIGYAVNQQFAGVFDGNGHTIKNINVATSARGLAGLFGVTDTISVIKNLTLESPVVHSRNSFAGTVAAYVLNTIDNCHVINPEVYNEGACAGGIAGVAYTVTNSTVKGGTITGLKAYVGGVAGEIETVVTDCHVSGTTLYGSSSDATGTIGGIVGTLYAANAENCSFVGTIKANLGDPGMRGGGIAGLAYLAKVNKCFSALDYTGYSLESEAVSGGLVGTLCGYLTNSYSVGRVQATGNKRTGGLTGLVNQFALGTTLYQSRVQNCYTATTIVSDTYQYDRENEYRETLGVIYSGASPLIENIYFDSQVCNLTSTHYGVKTADLISATALPGLNTDNWYISQGNYPRIKGLEDLDDSKFSASAVEMSSTSSTSALFKDATLHPLGNTAYYLRKNGKNSSTGSFSSIADKTFKVGNEFGQDTLIVTNGDVELFYTYEIAPVPFDGEGTADSPFLLKTKADLITLSSAATTSGQRFAGVYLKMANDIDLELDKNFIGICCNAADAYNKFTGIFDGDGHTLHHLYIGGVAWKVRPEDATDGRGITDDNNCTSFRGFIGRLAPTGVLKNLNIASDAFYEGWGNIGGFVGYCEGTVDNCRNYADVTGYSGRVGGIIGQMTAQGTVRNCLNAGDVRSGYDEVGGIAGIGAHVIENCVNFGNVSSSSISSFIAEGDNRLSNAGGIAGTGNSMTLKNVANYGTVYAASKNAGSIIGAMASKGVLTIENVVNAGTAYNGDNTTLGSFSGTCAETVSAKNVYIDGQILTLRACGSSTPSGFNLVNTSALTSATPLEGLSTEDWDFAAGKYPILKQYADEAKGELLRSIVVNIPEGYSSDVMNVDAALVAPQGVTWTLQDSTKFAVADGVLKAPAKISGIINDVLTAYYDGRVARRVELKAVPIVPLEGEGTVEKPYLIKSADNWNALAEFMNSANDDMKDTHIKVANDIDFSGKDFSPIGNSVTYFEAALDGDNHTISNISYTTTASYGGLFGFVGENGSISNITFSGKISSAYTYTGAIVGKLYGNLENVTNLVDVESTKTGVAGIAAYTYGPVSMTNCVNKATLTGSMGTIAGLVLNADKVPGKKYINCRNEGVLKTTATSNTLSLAGLIVTQSAPAEFINCANVGKFDIATPSVVSSVAGLVLNISSPSDTVGSYVFKNCYNTADITAKAKMAGLTGMITANKTFILMDSCYNTGNLTGLTKTASSPSAGLVMYTGKNCTISNCYNTGNITSASQYTAGIGGYFSGTATEDMPCQFINCVNYGNITGNELITGGVVGQTGSYSTLQNCVNYGKVSGTRSVGGIAGATNGIYDKVIACYNLGEVTGSVNTIGGICGAHGSTSGGEMIDCFNLANVTNTNTTKTATGTTGGQATGGIAGSSSAAISRSFNAGVVTGPAQVGGLVGLPSQGKTSLTSCYNIGKVVADLDTCGNILGVNIANGKIWNDKNSISDCYYLADNPATKLDSLVTPLTVAQLAGKDLGNGWLAPDKYSLPIPAVFASTPAALVHAAAVVVDENDSYSHVTRNFNVGAPAGVVWTASEPDLISFSGNDATFLKSWNSDFVLTATLGDFSKTVNLTAEITVSALTDIESDAQIVEETFYTISGVQVPKPAYPDGQIYIVRILYNDGTSRALKLLNK